MSRIRLKSVLKDGAIIILISSLLLFSIEGFFSFVIEAYDLWTNPRIVAENVHTEYDPVIGWINRENCFIQNMYGPGIYLKTTLNDLNRINRTPNRTVLLVHLSLFEDYRKSIPRESCSGA